MNLNLQGAVAALKAYQQARKGNVVSTETVAARAAICFRCPKRKVTRGVSKVSEMLGILANRNRVPNAVASYSCSVCSCSLMMLLPAVKEDLHKDSPEEAKERPDSCWIKHLDKSANPS